MLGNIISKLQISQKKLVEVKWQQDPHPVDRVKKQKTNGVGDKFETHFECKNVHSLHSLGAKNRPMSTNFILTHPGRLRAELPPRADCPTSGPVHLRPWFHTKTPKVTPS